ncbi:nucleolar transcription factor 1-B-like [Euwallacea fornicatus]|uniref:nucleolar transcription factor 1-B-like n=1 Tax=Euwallacea fornicatus TaxID=995702 RepID=UPI00339011E9
MKRKRLESGDGPPTEPAKTKRQKALIKSNDLNGAVPEERDEYFQVPKPKIQWKKAVSSSTSNPRKSGRSPKKKSAADVNQNGEISPNLTEEIVKSKIHSQKRKKNGVPGSTVSKTQYLTETEVNVQREELNLDEPLAPVPEKKKRGRKPQVKPITNDQPLNLNISSPSMPGVLKNPSKPIVEYCKQELEYALTDPEPISTKRAKKKVRIDETESLKIKKELSESESHFSSRELPAKIIKSKLNKNLTEEVKLSPLAKHISESEGNDLRSSLKWDHKSPDVFLKEVDCASSEGSSLENFYVNKIAEKEAKKKSQQKSLILMPKEDQLILVQRLQQIIPEGDNKSYKYRLRNLDWQNILFKNYSLEECQKVWRQLLKKIRHYRLLMEITEDIKHVIEQIDLTEASPSKPRKTKKARHPDMPKRPLTSYFLYFMRKRDKICSEQPDLDSLELNKYISKKYQSLSAEKKQKYEAIAAKNKGDYKRQLEEFYVKHPECRKVVVKKQQRAPKEKPPKRPDIPYKVFVLAESNREEIADEDKAEFKEVCREKWRQMSEEKKLTWIQLAEESYLKYEQDLKDFMSRHPEYTPKTAHKPFLTREEIQLKDKLAGKPKKPPSTAYGLFISMTLQSSEVVDIPHKERWNYTSIKWKAMTDEEREQYKQLLIQVQEQYQKDFETYLQSLPNDKRQEEIMKNLPKKRKKATTPRASTSGAKRKSSSTKSQPSRTKKSDSPAKVENPIPPPRSAFKYFVEKQKSDNPKEAWKNLSAADKEKFEEELSVIKEKYIKDFEAYLKSLTKDELADFCAKRSSQEEYTSSDESESESDHEAEESSDENSESSESENETDEH